MPLYRAEISSPKPDIVMIASYWADDENVALERAAQEHKVKKKYVTVIPVEPDENEILSRIENSVGGLFFTPRVEWESGHLVGLDLGQPHLCWGNLRDKHLRPLSALKHLKSLSLRGNLKVTDKGLSILAELPKLESLILDEMQIGDDCLPYLSKSTELSTLYLGKNTLLDAKIKRKVNITDAGLRNLANLGRLRAVSLSYTDVTGKGFSSFSAVFNLQHLFADSTLFSDEGMTNIARMTSLKQLHVQDTSVSDEGLKYLADLPELEILYLKNTNVTDDGIAKLGRLKSLRQLWLAGTHVTKKGVNALNARLPLKPAVAN
jgi:Leucine-rich repeat (LRR) protein